MTFSDALAHVDPLYQIPNQDLVGEVLVPAIRLSEEVRIEAGFFLLDVWHRWHLD